MKIEFLASILPPPRKSEQISAKDWQDLEHKTGISFPIDYQSYLEVYGPGEINDFIRFYSPFASNLDLNNFSVARTLKMWDNHSLDLFKKRFLPDLYPDPNGLLPLGGTSNGDMIFWQLINKKVTNSIIVHEGRGPDRELFSSSFLDWLHGYFRGILLVWYSQKMLLRK